MKVRMGDTFKSSQINRFSAKSFNELDSIDNDRSPQDVC